MKIVSIPANRLLFIVSMLVVFGCKKENIYLEGGKPELVLYSDNPRFAEPVIQFSKDTVYILGSNVICRAGQELSIEAGTLVKVQNRLSVTIEQGGIITANGTATEPIIFTSAAAKGTAGPIGSDGTGTNYWYGIRINGDPGQPSQSSGSLSYCRIEFAGGDEDFLNIPCLLLNNIGTTTSIHHIQVSYSFSTPSFGFSGGTCNAAYLLSYASNGNDFWINNGYTGLLQFILAYRHPFFPVLGPGANLAGVHIEGENTNPVITNLTVLGPDYQKGNSLTYSERDPSSAVLVNGQAKFKIRNSVLMGFPKTAIYINERNAARSLQVGESELTYTFMQSVDTTKICNLPAGVYPPFTAKDFKDFMAEGRFNNVLLLNYTDLGFANPFNYESPDPMPKDGSPLLAGADFQGNSFNNSFFTIVPFRGAIGTENWISNWTNFIPLQTTYNK